MRSCGNLMARLCSSIYILLQSALLHEGYYNYSRRVITLGRVYNLLRAFYIRIIEIWISNLSLSCVIYLELKMLF